MEKSATSKMQYKDSENSQTRQIPKWQWLLKMVRRDSLASFKKLSLFMASIVLGIAAVVSIESFNDNLKDNISVQSKALMGADFLIDSRHPPNERVQGIIDSLGGFDAREVNFSSMCLFPKNGGTKFIRVIGLEGGFPFYGTMETKPLSAATSFQQDGAALVDATVMIQFDLQPGDSIKIGEVTFPIAGSLMSAPGNSGFSNTIAPTVFIPYADVQRTGLIQTGSRVEYQYYFVSDEQTDLRAMGKKLAPILDQEDADIDTHYETSQRLGRRYDNFIVFLNLVAFIALLLGCIGIASSVHIYIKEKLRSVAILKCLGAQRKDTFSLYLMQILIMGLIGGIIGSLLGFALQETFPLIFADFLPFEVETEIKPVYFFMGLFLGMSMSVLFAMLPLLKTWYVTPLSVLRVNEEQNRSSKRAWGLIAAVITAFLILFSYWILGNWRNAIFFILGVLVTFGILSVLAYLFMRLIKKFFPDSWGFCARQSLLNLFRPQNQTLILVLTIGVGTFLISTLYFSKDMLLSKLDFERSEDTPNMILLDVQKEQSAQVAEKLDKVIDNIPIVTMRVSSINGRPNEEIRKDTASGVNPWMLDHEFRVTYRDSLIDSEMLIDGAWMPPHQQGQAIEISISESVARDAKVKVGDSISFNVQGVLMDTRIANIRQVDWGRLQLNFSLVFPSGVLESAPQFKVLSTSVPDDKASAALQTELIREFPNISILDLRQMLQQIDQVLQKISWVINFMAIFSIITGIIVLIGAIRNSKFQRIRENVLLRTLGATSKQILKIVALEYLYLGVLGSLSGILLSFVGAQILAWSVFEIAFTPSAFPFLVLFPGITLLVLLVGLLNSRSVLSSPPLQILRKEAK